MTDIRFSHLDDESRPTMVDVGDKNATARSALARTIIDLPPKVAGKLDADDMCGPKGSIVETAVLAGIQAAKKTPELIPLCHFISLDLVKLDIRREGESSIVVECRAKATHKTGVEMEALVGASVAALTIYDMCKALSHDIVIRETKLVEKTGGKNDFLRKES